MSQQEMGTIEIRNAGGRAETLNDPLLGLVFAAVRAGASDVHIDPTPAGYTIRLRVDGVVHQHNIVEEDTGHRLLNQLKVATDIDLERTREPAESQFDYLDPEGRRRDIRVTIIPTLGDEAAHLRLLTLPDNWRNIQELGLSEDELQQVQRVMEQPQGLVLVAGVTGSGKTTTQYALALAQDLQNHIAASIEDPVEFDLPNLRQIEVDEARGFTMADGLRVLLRMDPDVLLVGEARDRESSVTAAQAALGGRLVLATVHARDAAGAIDAMHFRAVPYYILASALRMIIVQNLVRKLCPNCAKSRPVREHERQMFAEYDITPPENVSDAVGCDECAATGYVGRTAAFELVTVDDGISAFLARGPHQQQIRKRFRETGSRPLIASALQKVADQVTSFEEIARLHSGELSTNGARNAGQTTAGAT